MNFESHLADLKGQVNRYIGEYFAELKSTMAKPGLKELFDSVQYSVDGGGHRVRPVLSLLTAEALGKDLKTVLPLGAAVELIHTYSLIHDDLPCMDDDDQRRGKPTNHKVFGEAIAVLAGDALNTEAFFLLARKYSGQPQLALDLISETALAAGTQGMVGGQAADVVLRSRDANIPEMEFLHSYKTGALFRLSILGAARVCDANTYQLKCLSDYARAFGFMYQIIDDINDGEKTGEPSFVKAVGLEKALETCEQLVTRAHAALEEFGDRAQGLKDFASQLGRRAKSC
jgi:geranylgeranyl diphosphate synthase type II